MNYKFLLLISIIIIYCYVNMNTYEGMTCGEWHSQSDTGCPMGKVLTTVDLETDHPTMRLKRGKDTCCVDSSMDDLLERLSRSGSGSGGGSDTGPSQYSFVTNVSETQMDQLKDYIRYLRCD